MENVFFSPRVGKNYEDNRFKGLKLLVLGESHYCRYNCKSCGDSSKKDCLDFTENVILRYINYKKGKEKHK